MPETDSPSAALPAALAAGGGYIVAGQLLRGLIRLAGIVLLARLLLPRDYGLFGMALVLHGFFAACRDFGLSAAAVRRPQLDAADKDRLFWLYLAAATAAAVLMAAAAPVAARIFGEPAVAPLLAALAASLVLTGLGAQSRIELVRAHRFRAVTAAEVASFAAGTAAALVSAVLGAGAWSLVLMIVTQEAVQAGWFLLAAGWRPGRWPGLGESGRDLATFGAGITLFAALNHIGQSVDQALVGTWFGAHELGLYGRASFIALLPGQFVLGPLTGWMVQTLARQQAHGAEFGTWFGRVLRAAAYLSVPLAAVMAARPDALVQGLLGAQWAAATEILPCFALLTVAQLYAIGEVWVLMACGRPTALVLWTAVRLGGAAAACWLARGHGLAAVALAVSAWQLLATAGSVALLTRLAPLRAGECLAPLARPLGLGLLLAAALWSTRGVSWPAAVPVGIATAALAVLLWPALRRDARDLLALRPGGGA